MGQKFTSRRPRWANYAVLQEWESKPYFAKIHAVNAEIEFARAKALHESGKAGGHFSAPKPRHLLAEEGIIVWDYLEGIIPLRAYLAREVDERPGEVESRKKLLFEIGKALRAVHLALKDVGGEQVNSPFEKIETPSSALTDHVRRTLREAEVLPVHGDFGCINVYLAEQGGRRELVILDPTMNKYLYPDWRELKQVASPVYVDCAQFVYTLWFNSAFQKKIASEVESLSESFLHGYEKAGGEVLDRATVWSCTADIANKYRVFWQRRNPGRMKRILEWREERFRRRTQKALYTKAAQSLPA